MTGALRDLGLTTAQAPLVMAMGLIGILGNASALHRFASLARILRHGTARRPHAAR
jgi:hypothetical protein